MVITKWYLLVLINTDKYFTVESRRTTNFLLTKININVST